MAYPVGINTKDDAWMSYAYTTLIPLFSARRANRCYW